jgi:hypothetical protein
MALSPNAPDYVSQVRGIIGDVRENYLKKQQLFQQNEQAKAQNALAYAQLGAQRDNAALDSEYKMRALEQNAIQEQAKNDMLLEKSKLDARKDQYAAYKDAVAQDLNQKKYELDLDKEVRDSKKEADDLARKKAAGARMAEFSALAARKDYNGMNKWFEDARQDSFDLIDFQNMTNQAFAISKGVEDLSNVLLVKNAEPELQKFHNSAAELQANLENLSPIERNNAIADLSKQASMFKTQLRDKTTTDALDVSLASVNNMKKAVEEKAQFQDVDNFMADGDDQRIAAVSPTIQKKYDDLIARNPTEEEQATRTFQREKRLLYLDYNQAKSAIELTRRAKQLADLEAAQMSNPDFTIVGEDGVKRPKFPAPDLRPSYENGTLDRNNNISPEIIAEIKAYENKLRIPGVAKEQRDPTAQLMEGFANMERIKRGEKPMSAGAETPAAADTAKMRFSNTWALNPPPVKAGGIPVSGAEPGATPAATPATPEAPATDTTDYRRNAALLEEVDRQIKAGNKTYIQDGKPTNINLSTLRNRIQSRMGARVIGTFNPPPSGMVSDFLTPPLAPQQPLGEVAE